jgi:hypothetical protein
MTPSGWWSIKCERCGKNDAENGEFPFETVFDEQAERNVLVCLDCYRPDDLPPVSEPSRTGAFKRFDRFAKRIKPPKRRE